MEGEHPALNPPEHVASESHVLFSEDDDSFDGPIHRFRLDDVCEVVGNEHCAHQQNALIPVEAPDYDDNDDNLKLGMN